MLFFMALMITFLHQPLYGIKMTIDNNIDVQKAAEFTSEFLAEAQKIARENKQKLLAALQQQRDARVALAQRFASGAFSEEEYKQRLLAVNDEINRLEKIMQRDDDLNNNITNGIHHAISSGWDLFMNKQKEHEHRRTEIARTREKQQLKNQGALERLQLLTDAEVMKRTAIASIAVGSTLIGAYYGFSFAHHYFKTRFDTPQCIHTTSVNSLRDKIYGWLYGDQTPKDHLEKIVLSASCAEQIRAIAEDIKSAHTFQLPLKNLLLYGPPGTGKTLIAKALAQYSGLDYALTSGAALAQCKPGDDIKQLIEIFDWAESTEKGLIIFFDEIDALAMRRDKASEQQTKLLSEFLSRTGSGSSKIMIVGATNQPEALDPAFLSRMDYFLEIPLPSLNERIALIKNYIQDYIANEQRTIPGEHGQTVQISIAIDPEISDDYIAEIAQKIDGFSGRDIEKMISEIRSACYRASSNYRLTKQLMSNVISHRIMQKEAKKNRPTLLIP